MVTEKNSEFENRVVVLRRCDLPKDKSILELNSFDTSHSFVSFQNYHFIDILSSNQVGTLPLAYEMIREVRQDFQSQAKKTTQDNFSYGPEIHTVQSMALLGEKSSFWDTPTDILYITFIQQIDSSQWTYDAIAQEMESRYPDITCQGKPYPRWHLCYSLDFCDLMLFTRGIGLEELNSLLWNMTINNDAGFSDIQDTFTICAFNRSFLEKAFASIESNEKIEWDDTVSISCKIGIQHPNSLSLLQESLAKTNVEWKMHKLTGRYDLLVEGVDIPGDQALRFFYEIDKLTSGSPSNILANFEVTLMTPLKNITQIDCKEDTIIVDPFVKNASQKIVNLYQKYRQITHDHIKFIDDYVYETFHSLQELLRNGFAEEFVLSVFPSFEAYISVACDLDDTINNFSGKEIDSKRLAREISNFDDLTREFFSAINTLSSCTMHNERQFIQAPSFNAAYFEIPPKLLVFYNALVKRISQKLHTQGDDNYQFLITPDYRHNINVLPFESIEGGSEKQHIAIIYLSEKYFYDPVKAIMLLGHEVGHYIGDRYRKKRAEQIFNAIGCVAVYIYFPMIKGVDEDSIYNISRIAGNAIGKCLLDYYSRTRPYRKRQYYFADVKEFVDVIVNNLTAFVIELLRTNMAVEVGNELQKYAESNPKIVEAFRKILKEIDRKNETTYYSDSVIFKHDYRFGSNILAQFILDEVFSNFDPAFDTAGKNHDNFFKICESIVQAFSESFADLQMRRICGDNFSVAQYANLLLDDGNASLDRSIRFHVMKNLSVTFGCVNEDAFSDYDHNFLYTNRYCQIIEELVLNYLSTCDCKNSPIQDVDSFIVQPFNLYEHAKSICHFMQSYKAEVLS